MIDYEELAKRAVACKAWRWMPGMSVVSDTNHDALVWHDTSIVYFDEDDVPCAGHIDSTDLPDLADSATIGCLLHLVREHWGDHGTYARRIYRSGGSERWLCTSPNVRYELLKVGGETEAECLVKALEMKVGDD